MKRLSAGLLAGAVLGSAGAALAGDAGHSTKAIPLTAGQAVSYAGLTCTTYAGTTATNANLVCVRTNLKGYGVVVSQEAVIVAKQLGKQVKVIFRTKNG
jgi:hypothetical protein